MMILMILIFLIGYLLIALEHPLKINKAGIALFTGTILWVIYTLNADSFVPVVSGKDFAAFLEATPELSKLPLIDQCVNFIVNHQLLLSIGEISETLTFLIGAMVTVELVDSHGGFQFVTNRIHTNNKRKLFLIISFLTFFMSAILDNLTTAIVMIMVVRKLIANQRERWLFGSIIIIAANSGGAWSPIGDVTTIMLWVKGNITTASTMSHLFLPSFVSVLIPVILIARCLHGNVEAPEVGNNGAMKGKTLIDYLRVKERLAIFVLGLSCLLFVPIFKTITHLPPFVGILLGVGVLWIFTELMYRKMPIDEEIKLRLPQVIGRIDGATLMFFLGILLSIDALKYVGVLGNLSVWLDQNIGNIYVVNLLVGAISAVIDNVPIVAGVMGMYPLANEALVSGAADPVYMASFMQDGSFWQFLAYCAGVGGSMLVIGSAAGVVVMGLEKIDFIWYTKKITILAFLGYVSGAAVFILEQLFC